MYFDSHCHLNSEELYPSYGVLIQEARNENVHLIMVPGYDYLSCEKVLQLIKNEGIYGAIGLQPEEITNDNLKKIYDLFSQIKSYKKIKAIGEIGLDYYMEKDERKKQIQRQVFIEQIKIANELNLPIIVHCRDAFEDTYNILKENPLKAGGVMHCYSGSIEMMKKFINLGFYISLGGPVTFKNARVAKEIAHAIDLNYLLIETDAPYLTPHPYRGTINKPSRVVLIAQEIANIKNIDIKIIEKKTTENAKRLFKIDDEEKN